MLIIFEACTRRSIDDVMGFSISPLENLSMRIKVRSEKASASSIDGNLLLRCFRIIQLRLICSCLFCIASGSRHCSVIYLEKSIKIP